MEPEEALNTTSLLRELASDCQELSAKLKYQSRHVTSAAVKAALLEPSIALLKIGEILDQEAARFSPLKPQGRVREMLEDASLAAEQLRAQVFPPRGKVLLDDAADELQDLESKFAGAKEECRNLEARTEVIRQYHSVQELAKRARLAAADAAE